MSSSETNTGLEDNENNNNVNEKNADINAEKKCKMSEHSDGYFQCVWIWLCGLFGSITIEPAYFLFALGGGIYGIASEEIYIEKTCR